MSLHEIQRPTYMPRSQRCCALAPWQVREKEPKIAVQQGGSQVLSSSGTCRGQLHCHGAPDALPVGPSGRDAAGGEAIDQAELQGCDPCPRLISCRSQLPASPWSSRKTHHRLTPSHCTLHLGVCAQWESCAAVRTRLIRSRFLVWMSSSDAARLCDRPDNCRARLSYPQACPTEPEPEARRDAPRGDVLLVCAVEQHAGLQCR
jgi:hypothetical protein